MIAGHSYGGQVMTALGTTPRRRRVVTPAAFGIDEGESLGALLAQGPPTPALAHRFVDERGFVWLTENDFVNHFAGDLDAIKAAAYAVQQPLSASAFDDVMTVPAWKGFPSWYIVAQEDQALPPDVERMFATRMGATSVEVRSGHLAMVSHPDEVVKLTETAAEAALVVTAGQLSTTPIPRLAPASTSTRVLAGEFEGGRSGGVGGTGASA